MKTETNIKISSLRARLKNKVIGSEDPRYDAERRVFFNGFDRRPAVIVRAGDASDVGRVVSLARETGSELAVRSGGRYVRRRNRPRPLGDECGRNRQ